MDSGDSNFTAFYSLVISAMSKTEEGYAKILLQKVQEYDQRAPTLLLLRERGERRERKGGRKGRWGSMFNRGLETKTAAPAPHHIR
jgi:hypothetical protein